MSVGPCAVQACEKIARSGKAGAYCEMHYGRMRRNGHLDPLPKPAARQCAVPECLSPARTRGMCGMHAERVRRHGDPGVLIYRVGDGGALHPSWRGDAVGYSAVHMRLRADRGSATHRTCIDCGTTAAHWSYDHMDVDELHGNEGAYSLKAEHYHPRCVSCHKAHDLALR